MDNWNPKKISKKEGVEWIWRYIFQIKWERIELFLLNSNTVLPGKNCGCLDWIRQKISKKTGSGMNMKIDFSNKMGTNRIIFIKFQYSVAK